MYSDKTIVCQDCSQNFEFTVAEQEFYAQKGFDNEPKRCPACRKAKKQARGGGRGGYGGGGYGGGGYDRPPRQMYDVVCAACGNQTTVPFRPSGDRPVYCRDCYQG
jgi:CxxC-x17-CxxC domain-containing protein